MFDIGWQEIIILMLIALIVVGPKDLPRVVKTAGQWMGKARGYARDFQRTIEEAADATEIDAIKKEIDEANRELSTARRDVAEGADAIKKDVAEGTDSVNKMFSEDAMAAAKANGGEPPAGQPGRKRTAARPRPPLHLRPRERARSRTGGTDGDCGASRQRHGRSTPAWRERLGTGRDSLDVDAAPAWRVNAAQARPRGERAAHPLRDDTGRCPGESLARG